MENRELNETIVALIIMIVMAGIVTLTAGLTGGGFESAEFKSIFTFYAPILAFSVIGIFLLRLGEQNNSSKYFAFIHDPEKGFFENIGIVKNPYTLIGICLVIFTVIGLIGALTNTFFVATPQAFTIPSQQISTASELLFGVEPSATTETALFLLIMFGLMSLAKLTLFKNIDFKKNKGMYFVAIFVLSLIIGLIWMSYHSIRYGSIETSLLFTFFFGFFGALLTLSTGSIIPWWIWHFENNLFFQANRMFSDDRIIVFTILALVIIVVPIILISLLKKKGAT